MTTGQFLWGLSNGVLVLAVSGAFWLGLGLGQVAFAQGIFPWLAVMAIMVGGVAVFVRSAVLLKRRSGFHRSDLLRTDLQTLRILKGFRNIGLMETALVGTAVLLCMRFHHQELLWPAIGVAVSLHFTPLARLFDVPAYYVTSGIGAVISTTALCAPLASMRLIWLGVGMSAVTWSTAFYLVCRADVIAARALASLAGSTSNKF